MNGKVVGLMRFIEKGKPGEALEKAILLDDMGIEHDRSCKRGASRQASLLEADVRAWMEEQQTQGLCFQRYRENLTVDGVALSETGIGDRLAVGECILEITGNKECFQECARVQAGLPCRLAQSARYASVAKGGVLQLGDPVQRMPGKG